MNTIILKPQPLSTANFRIFGEVVSIKNNQFIAINNGYAKKYANLAKIDSSANNGKSTVHIFQAKIRKLPLEITMLEQHPFFSQLFMPLNQQQFLIVVAPVGGEPNPQNIQAFITNGKQGINYARAVWHFPLISLQDKADFMVVDRLNTNDETVQCMEHNFSNQNITLEYQNIA